MILIPQLVAAVLILFPSFAFGCFGIGIPEDAVILRGFAPIGRWAGHWGIDIDASGGSTVLAIGDGVVRFAGVVAYNRTVSIDHGGGLITSYSYLAETTALKGESITRGDAIGTAGIHDGRSAFHLSLRVAGKYIDPLALRRCSSGPSRGLYLAVGPTTYAVGRARDSRRHIRPATQRSYRYGSRRVHPTGARRRASHARR